ncbi:MAG: PAS domain-containing protein, partial [Candidatus Aminicenantales bacterium]
MTEEPKTPSLVRKQIPWQLLVILLLLAAGLAGGFLAPPALMPFITGAFIILCGALLVLLWRVAVNAHDRFDRAKWDQANKTMTDFMQVLIDIMPNPAFFKDTEGRYRGTNPAFEKLLGKAKSELIGKTIGDVAPQEIVDKHQEHDQT